MALNPTTYTKTLWEPQKPITAPEMNNIEDNLKKVYDAMSDAQDTIAKHTTAIGYSDSEIATDGSIKAHIVAISGVAQGAASTANTAASSVSSFNTRIETVENTITGAKNALESTGSSPDDFAARMQKLKDKVYNMEGAYQSADSALSGRITTAQGTAQTAVDALTNAAGIYETVAQRIDAIEQTNTTQDLAFNTLKGRVDAPISGDTKNMEQHISSLTSRASGIEDEIETARGVDSLNVARDNLNARFVDDETRIGNAEGRITTLETATGTTIPNRIGAVETRVGTAEGKITAIETEIGGAHRTSGDTLDTRFDDIESELTSAKDTYNSIDARFDAVEAIANAAATATTVSGIDGRVTTLESTVNDSTTGLAATKVIADAAKAKADTALQPADIATLSSDVETLKGKDTIIIDKTQITYDSEGVPTNIGQTPTANADYLLQNADDKYYYWRYINNSWQLISGGGEGGSGTSSAAIVSTLPATSEADENTDYYVGNATNGYTHYRYYNNEWITILPKHLVNSVYVDISTVGEGENAPRKSRPVISEMGSNLNLLADFHAIQEITSTSSDEGTTLRWVNIDGEAQQVTITGGGGGSSSNVTTFINRVTNANITTIIGEACPINYAYSATERIGDRDEIIATTGTGVWYVNSARVATQNVTVNDITDETDYNTFDIGPYLRTGQNNISLSVTITANGQTFTSSKTWVITVVNFSLVWDYDESTINSSSNINFSCTPYGMDITKTLYLKVGSHQQSQTVTTSGISTTVTLTANLGHGSYTAEMWMTATINNELRTTPHISHDFIVVAPGNNTPIIAATLPVAEMDQYDTIEIPFVVYTPNSNTSTVVLAIDGVNVDSREVGRTIQKWYFTPSTLGTDIIYEDEVPVSGTHTLTLTVGSVVKILTIKTNSVQINNEEIGGYAFKLKASELISNTTLQNWHYDELNPTTTKLQFSNNFDWINGGLKTELDENGDIRQYIRIKSGTRMTIPYKMFASDPRELGSDFKIVFKVENCRDYDAQILDTVSDNIGIQLNAHNATFQSTTTTVSTQYGEDEYTELEFEVYKRTNNNNEPVPGQYMMAWIDGVITAARIYGGNFSQSAGNASSIVIGSDDCDVCVYLVKYYPKALTINDHVINFIADAPNASEMVRRFIRNDILDPDDNEIDYQKLMNNNPDCRIWLYDIEKMPTSKDKDLATKVYNFQQLWKNGDRYYQLVGENAKLTIQGTSSVNYRKGAANTDINFGKSGAILRDGYGNDLLADNLEYKGFKINDNSLPITYSNTKVNFASCEQVNNMCNAEWYQRFQPYPSLSARDCMEFVMGVQFIHDRGENEESGEVRLFNEKPNRSDSKYYMYSIANMGTSKKNTHIFHDPNEVCVEVMANTSKGQRMLEWPADLDWSGKVEGKDHSFELRYAEDENEDAAKVGWKRFIDWMASYNLSPYDAENNPNGYTSAALAEPVTFAPYTFRGHNREITQVEGRNFEQVLRGVTVNQYAGTYTNDTFEYRMAKMLSECEDYMAMDSVVYHFLFIERHTMVDNVAKNTFWSSVKEVGPNNEEGFWVWDLSKNYDNDTSDGNNNEGQLVFDYGNEATDTYGAKTVFNAADSVWFIFISNLYEACRAMFINREGRGAWNAKNYHEYLLNEQRKVPERVWNECYWYDYLRTYENNIDTSWITFLDGGQKTHQRKHYETYEELYDASKYMSALSASNTVNMRGYTPPAGTWSGVEPKTEFKVKMYNKCYLTIHVDDAYKQIKCEKGVNNTISFYNNNNPAQGYTTMNDAVIKMDTAQMIQEIGDLSCLYLGSSSFTSATRLRVLHIGSAATGYINPNMTSTEQLTFTNPMLEELDVQNLPYATYNLDLSKCPELKYINAAGSGFTGFEFANGGLLNEAYLNNPSHLVMRNLDLLTNANLSITDLTAIKQLRLEGCKLFDTRTFIESLDLNILRLTGIDWTVNDDEPILNNLLSIMGMNELGYTISQSYLSGEVSLTGVVYSGVRDRYAAAWPDLEIDTSHASQIVAQHLVTYMDENGETVLYTKYINNGNSIVDVVATGECAAPTKAADIQYRYTFGTLQYGSYIPYSGWRYSADSQSIYSIYGNNVPAVQSTTTVYAVYSTTPQQYSVRWLVGSKEIATSDPQNYGGGYGLSAPTIKEVKAKNVDTYSFQDNGNGTCNYRIMTGWEKLPTNIQPTSATGTYDIQATWLERTNVNIATMLTSNDYSVEEKLLVLKNAQSARNTLHLQDMYPVKLGYTGIKPAIDLLAAPKNYVGIADAPIAAYTPFNANTSFTMAIDYRFDHVVNDQAKEAVLVSCYDDSGTTTVGFKLFYDLQSASPVPQISFGSTDSVDESNVKKIGTSLQYRSMVVLRHRAGESTLTIYSGSNSNGLINNYVADEFRQGITLVNVPSSNAKIILGGINSSSTTSVNASGTIYAVKYWEEDLGEGECMQLANWCYETAHFAVQDFTGYDDPHSALPISNANLVLHTLNASEMGNAKDVAIQNSESSVGWDPSLLRTFYNGRLYQALPIKLQSIINLTPIIYVKANKTTNGYVISNNTSTTQDYVFASSHKEAFGTIAAYVGETGGTTSFGWGGLIIRQWSGSSFLAPYSDTSSYINLRFPYYPIAIGSTTKIFVGYPVVKGSFETYANENSLGLTTGDILIPEDSLVAYIYIGSTEIQNGAPFVKNSSNSALIASNGAWIESSSWWLRSVSTDATNGTAIQSNRSRFTFVSPLGNATTGRTFNNGIVYSIAL